MLFDHTKPVQTRDGRKAEIIKSDLKDLDGLKIVAIVTEDKGHQWVKTYGMTGRYLDNPNESRHDLVNIPERKSNWYNMYSGYCLCGDYLSREKADRSRTNGRKAVLEIIYEDEVPIEVKLHKDEK
jgi:hypothetical protein